MIASSEKTYYTVRATGRVHQRENSAERFGVELEIIEGDLTGEKKWFNADFGESWAEKTITALKLLGWDGTDDGTFPGLGTTRATAVEVEREYPAGTLRRDIRYINAYGVAKKGVSVLGPKYKRLIQSVKVDIDDTARLGNGVGTGETPF